MTKFDRASSSLSQRGPKSSPKIKPIVKPLEDVYLVESYKEYNKIDSELIRQIGRFEKGASIRERDTTSDHLN